MECRLCLDGSDPDTMLQPCQCRGTMAFVHRRCLNAYFQYYPDGVCRVCMATMRLYPLQAFQIFPWFVLPFLWYSIAYSGAEPSLQVLLGIGAGYLMYSYSQAVVFLNDILWMALGILVMYTWIPHDFVLNAILMSAMFVYTLSVYIPLPYLMVFFLIGIMGVYTIAFVYMMTSLLTSQGNGAILALILLTWLFYVRHRPFLRLAPA